MTLHRGKLAKHPTILGVRPLTRDDLAILRERRVGSDRSGGIVKRLRDPHHRLARLVAAGLSNIEICERTGRSIGSLSLHKSDPAFQELVAKYREKVDAAYERQMDEYAYVAIQNQLAGEYMIAEHIEEAQETGELLPMRTLLALTADRADRFGYGKRQMNVNVNADFAAVLERAVERTTAARTIDSAPLAPRAQDQSQREITAPAGSSPSVSSPRVRRLA